MSLTTFDQRWETKIYAEGRHLNRWPFDVVVSFVFRYCPPDVPREQVRILEVGCGAGNNLWFAAREGFSVYGVDASPTAVAYARQRFEKERLPADIRLADFTNLPFEDQFFDMVIDRYAISCVEPEVGRLAVGEVKRTLRPGGMFLFDCGSTQDGARAFRSQRSPDQEMTEGRYADLKLLSFYDRDALGVLFETGWEVVSMEHQIITDHMQPVHLRRADWRVIAKRKQSDLSISRHTMPVSSGQIVAAVTSPLQAVSESAGSTEGLVLPGTDGGVVVPASSVAARFGPGLAAAYLRQFGLSWY